MQRSFLAPLIVFVTVAMPGIPAAAEPVVLLPDSPAVPFVEYRFEIGQIGHADNTQWLRVYPDGRGLAHYPAFTRRAGTYEFQLSPGEVADLARYLIEQGALEIDLAAARAKQREVMHSRAEALRAGEAPGGASGARTLRVIQDAPYTTIVVNLGTAGSLSSQVQERRLSWYALEWHAREYPEIAALVRLAGIETRLRDLFARPDLELIE